MNDRIIETIIGTNEKKKNAVESLIGIFNTPIAKRKGITFSASECREWADELKIFLKNNSI